MFRTLGILTAAASFMFVSPIAAQDEPGSLVGSWLMTEVEGRTWNGSRYGEDAIGSIVLNITEHDGITIAGNYSWVHNVDTLAMNSGQGVTTVADEGFIGVKDFDGSYTVVDFPDTSIMRLRLVDENTIDTVFFESGPFAVVARTLFNRLPGTEVGTGD